EGRSSLIYDPAAAIRRGVYAMYVSQRQSGARSGGSPLSQCRPSTSPARATSPLSDTPRNLAAQARQGHYSLGPAERWVRSVNEECLSRLILFGEEPAATH